MAELKTPGVYIVEKHAFPNSIVQIDTSVAGFVGWTERNMRPGAPQRFTSFSEFESLCGGPPPVRFALARVASAAPSPDSAEGASVPLPGGDRIDILRATQPFSLHAAMRFFYLNGGSVAWIASAGGYDSTMGGEPLIEGLRTLSAGPDPALLLCPEAARLGRDEAARVNRALLDACGGSGSRFAVLDVPAGWRARNDAAGDPIAAFRADVAGPFASYGAAYYPWIATTIHSPSEFGLGALDAAGRTLVLHLVAEELRLYGRKESYVKDFMARIAAETDEAADKALRSASKGFAAMCGAMAGIANLQPPSAAMAGLYTMTDNARGVWSAPANISVSAAASPAAKIDEGAQADLNAPVAGAAVNAIRSFIGEGVLVWGARTLDAASLDWRYIPVRRTAILVEGSIRAALPAYSFDANDASTWTTIRAMVANFLTGLWKAGAFAGAKPEEAFSVHIGLGETMTAQDILGGRIRLSVRFAPVRPAEFIVLQFEQEMAAK